MPLTVLENKELHRDDERYAYPVARILSEERSMLDKTKQERLLSSRNIAEAIKMLVDSGYEEPKESGDFESLLKEENKNLYTKIRALLPEPKLLDILAIRNDFHNMKIILKAEFQDKDISEFANILSDSGTIQKDKLVLIITDRKIIVLGEEIEKAIIESIDTFNRTKDPQTIDIILDKTCYSIMYKKVLETSNSFYIDVIKHMIDLVNIKVFLRTKTQGKNANFLHNALFNGGFTRKDRYIENYEKSYEEIALAFKSSNVGKFLEDAVNDYIKSGRWTKLEKLADDYLINYLKTAHNMSLGIEPIIGYLLGKEIEFKNIGIIMVGKENNIPTEIIRSRLRLSYV